jgi:phosphoribosyl 1,2-cyclic phosphodiesterase
MDFTPIASSSKGNAYLVEANGVGPLLLECGIPIKQLREKLHFGLSGLAGCLISHEHGDHAKAAKDLLKAGVDIYTSPETAEALGINGHHRFVPVNAEHVYNISGWLVLPFDLHHDVPCHGFMIASPDGDRLLFIPDTSYIRNRFEGINLLAIECNHMADILSENIQGGHIPAVVGKRVRRNHMSLESVIGMLKANDLSGCREIWLLHLSDGNSDEARMIRAVQSATGIPCRAACEGK